MTLSKIMKHKMITNNRGFTAAEIITVVAIIAILTLIVVPKFWNRTEEARITKAKEDMSRILEAEAFCYAENGVYVHPSNLVTAEVPGITVLTTWNYNNWLVSTQSTKYILPDISTGWVISTVYNWKGSYISIQKSETSFYGILDPWKNPYVFFGPISLTNLSNDTVQGSKIRIWSAGPNMRFDSQTAMPWGGTLGDDILWER